MLHSMHDVGCITTAGFAADVVSVISCSLHQLLLLLLLLLLWKHVEAWQLLLQCCQLLLLQQRPAG
jgi:hypothetical protein